MSCYKRRIFYTNGLFCSCTGILYYFSSTANPILYNLMSRKFRAAFRRTVCCWFRCGSCERNTRALIPVAPAPVVQYAVDHPRVPPRRSGRAVMPADKPAADDRSANDGLFPQRQVLCQMLFLYRTNSVYLLGNWLDFLLRSQCWRKYFDLSI